MIFFSESLLLHNDFFPLLTRIYYMLLCGFESYQNPNFFCIFLEKFQFLILHFVSGFKRQFKTNIFGLGGIRTHINNFSETAVRKLHCELHFKLCNRSVYVNRISVKIKSWILGMFKSTVADSRTQDYLSHVSLDIMGGRVVARNFCPFFPWLHPPPPGRVSTVFN